MSSRLISAGRSRDFRPDPRTATAMRPLTRLFSAASSDEEAAPRRSRSPLPNPEPAAAASDAARSPIIDARRATAPPAGTEGERIARQLPALHGRHAEPDTRNQSTSVSSGSGGSSVLRSRLIRSPPDSSAEAALPFPAGDWLSQILASTALARSRLGEQGRPLRVHSGFSGMMSHSAVLQALGLEFIDLAAAEPKEHARQFAKLNGILPRHLFLDIRHIIRRERADCMICQTTCAPPLDEPDIFIAGFSCQPFSPSRGKNLTKTPPREHPKFDGLLLTLEYLRAWRPPVAVLENTIGFLRRIRFGRQRAGAARPAPVAEDAEDGLEETFEANEPEDDGISGGQYLRQELEGLYFVGWVKLDSKPWVQMRRPRVWLILMRADIGSQATVDDACRIAADIQQHREEYRPAQVREMCCAPGSKEEGALLLALALAHEERQHSSAKHQPPPAAARWRQQVQQQRDEWHAEGRAAARAHPLASARLRGLSDNERIRESLEVNLLRACFAQDLDPAVPDQLERAKANLIADASQNYRWMSASLDVAPCFQRVSMPYSYELDRVLGPLELLRCHGWIQPHTGNISVSNIRDLAGEAQTLPCLAAAIMGALLAAGTALHGLWPRADFNRAAL